MESKELIKEAKRTKKSIELCNFICKCSKTGLKYSNSFKEIVAKRVFVTDKNLIAKTLFLTTPCFKNYLTVQEALDTVPKLTEKVFLLKEVMKALDTNLAINDRDAIYAYNQTYGSKYGWLVDARFISDDDKTISR